MPNSAALDDKILAQVRSRIDEFIEPYCINQSTESRLRLRQLPWYALDILIYTGNVNTLQTNDVIQQIITDVRNIGASEQFIKDSLALAVSIYTTMQLDHPEVLKRYKV